MGGDMQRHVLCWILIAGLAGWAGPLYAFELSRVERSVVRVINQSQGGGGSGTVINANGDVLTNRHVTEGSRRLFVISEFSTEPQPARIVWESADKDLAVIRVLGLDLPAATLFSGELKKTAVVRAIGYPGVSDMGSMALDATVTPGEISRIFPSPQTDWNVTIVQHTAGINSGNSGGPLFDNCGRVVGVNTAGPNRDSEDTNWASHIKEAINLLRQHGTDFLPDDSPCVSATPAAPGSSDAGVDEQARAQADQATQAVENVKSQVEGVQQGAQQAQQQAESATQTAQEAQAQADQATQAVEEALQADRMTNTLVALVAVVTLVALGLALRKPRQEIIHVAGHIAAPLSRLAQSVRRRKPDIAAPLSRLAQSVRRKKPDIALTGFDAQGRPVTLSVGPCRP